MNGIGVHSPNAPPDSYREGVPWCTSNTTDKSIKFTNFDDEFTELFCMPLTGLHKLQQQLIYYNLKKNR
jgi:hypothetical protein